MRKLIYLADADMKLGQVPAIQIMNTCAGFAAAGWDVTLVAFNYFGGPEKTIDGNYWSYFGLQPTFAIRWLPTPLWRRLRSFKAVSRLLKTVPVLLYALTLFLRGDRGRDAVIYGRSPGFLLVVAVVRRFLGGRDGSAIVYESHEPLSGRDYPRLLAAVDGVVPLTHKLAEHLTGTYGVPVSKMFVEPDAADTTRFGRPLAAQQIAEIRRSWLVPAGDRVCCWAGQLLEREMKLIIDCAQFVPANCNFIVIGGTPEQSAALNEIARQAGARVRFVGPLPHAAIAASLQAADILIAPYSTALRYAAFFSPMKIFEYMATGKPIVCSDLPAIREILEHDRNAYLVAPDSARSFAEGVSAVAENMTLAERLASAARESAKRHTWLQRSSRITAFVDSLQRKETTFSTIA